MRGDKKLETRNYPIPRKYLGVELALIETPGPKGKEAAGIAKARVIGTITFVECYKYRGREHWLKEQGLHKVKPDEGQFRYSPDMEKWAWKVGKVKRLDTPVNPPAKRGIVFAKRCKVPEV